MRATFITASRIIYHAHESWNQQLEKIRNPGNERFSISDHDFSSIFQSRFFILHFDTLFSEEFEFLAVITSFHLWVLVGFTLCGFIWRPCLKKLKYVYKAKSTYVVVIETWIRHDTDMPPSRDPSMELKASLTDIRALQSGLDNKLMVQSTFDLLDMAKTAMKSQVIYQQKWSGS